jgi:hypothetical protein
MTRRLAFRLFLIVSLLVTAGLASHASHSASYAVAATGSGSITARVFICPDGLTLAAVQGSANLGAPLADCEPSASPIIVPQLRALPGGTPQPGTAFADGVYLWSGRAFGSGGGTLHLRLAAGSSPMAPIWPYPIRRKDPLRSAPPRPTSSAGSTSLGRIIFRRDRFLSPFTDARMPTL